MYLNKFSFIKKGLFILTALLISTTFGIEKDPCLPKDACCEVAKDPFAFSYQRDVGLVCPRDFYAYAEFLWMKPSEEGLEYAMSLTGAASNQFPVQKGKIKGFSRDSDEWDWRPGFRAGFAYYKGRDFWCFSADWTYLRIKADSEVSGENLSALFNRAQAVVYLLVPDRVLFVMQNASARWSGDCNILDIMMGKPYHVSRYFISHPKFGIRAVVIDQDYHIRYHQGASFPFVTPTAVPEMKRNIFLKNDYVGAGIRALYEGEFKISSSWTILSKTAFSLLFGKFDLSQQSENNITDGISASIDSNVHSMKYKTEDSFYIFLPNAEISMGFSWSKFINKNRHLLSLKVSYEFQHFWNQNQARRFFDPDPVANDTISRGDLSFNGFVFGLNIDI